MRRFQLRRLRDVSGVSGTGIVATGCELWPGGWCIVKWRGRWNTTVLHHQGIESVRAIHGHDGATIVEYT